MKATVMLLCLVGSALAGVNLKNGNFFMSYTDIIVGGLEITRTYNSKSVGSTEFGYGWGFEYAHWMSFPSDGVTIHQHGLGASTYLRFQGGRGDRMTKKSDHAGALLAAGNCASFLEADSVLSRLASEREERERFLQDGFSFSNEVHPVFAGEIAFEPPYVCRDPKCNLVHGEYALFSEGTMVKGDWGDGSGAKFSRDGTLLEITHGKEPSRKIVRNKAGKIAFIQQGADHIRFFYDDGGNLCRLVGSNGAEAEFQIDPAGDLVYTRDSRSNEYWYEYDDRHNLVRIGYDANDSSNETRITYDESSLCRSIRYPSGTLWEYRYGSNPERPNNHYWTETTQIPEFAPPAENRYEYFTSRQTGGVSRVEKSIFMVDGITTTTQYDFNGAPILVESDASAPLRLTEDGVSIQGAEGPVHRYRLAHDPEEKYLKELEITGISSSHKTRWIYGYAMIEGRRIMSSVTDGERMLEISTDRGVTILRMDDHQVFVGDGGRVSLDQNNWYNLEFRRMIKDGPLLAVLTAVDGKPITVPKLEGLLNSCRLLLGVSARQFLPPPLHGVRWYSFDP